MLRGLARCRDHRGHQNKLLDGCCFTDKRGGEATQRLRNEHHVDRPVDGTEDQAATRIRNQDELLTGEIRRRRGPC